MQAIKQAIVAAIQQGAPRYNAGDVAGCRDLYLATAQQILSSAPPAPVSQALR